MVMVESSLNPNMAHDGGSSQNELGDLGQLCVHLPRCKNVNLLRGKVVNRVLKGLRAY